MKTLWKAKRRKKHELVCEKERERERRVKDWQMKAKQQKQ